MPTAPPAPPSVDDPARLRPALGRVARGLSAVFWGLPAAFLFTARTLLADWHHLAEMIPLGLAPLVVAHGLGRLAEYQPQERIWRRTVVPAQRLMLVLAGLLPCVVLWGLLPQEPFFARATALTLALALAGVAVLAWVMRRLAAMLPDPALRGDARLFAGLCTWLAGVFVAFFVALFFRAQPMALGEFVQFIRRAPGAAQQGVLLLICLAPVAMVMSVAWKLKELALALALASARED
ncbi:MAG: hypothetical protein ACKVYV_07770 [Limisphaerales bacterium]